MSPETPIHSTPNALISEIFSSGISPRPLRMMFAPFFAKAIATAAPIPLVLPVINTFFPVSSMTYLRYLSLFPQMLLDSLPAEQGSIYRFFS